MTEPDDSPTGELARALGIEPGARVGIVNEPDGWLDELTPLPPGATLFERASEPLDVLVYFSDERANVERRVPAFAGFVAPGGTLWSAIPSSSEELDRAIVEEIAEGCGLQVDGHLAIAPGWTAFRLRKRDQQSDATRG
ncbi:MAG TPA: hypothetical protein VIG64_02215 [Actinomycetota bacterium]|jgi:hypothetical protein